MKKRKLTKLQRRWIIAASVIFVISIIPVGRFERFAEDAGQKLSLLGVLIRALVSLIKEIASLVAELLKLLSLTG